MNHVIVSSRSSSNEPEAPAGLGASTVVAPAADPEFIEILLAALTDMAVRSPRRQADLAVALRRSGIDVAAPVVRKALDSLAQDGCIERLVPLADGGLLMQITSHGIERLSKTSRRHVLDYAR